MKLRILASTKPNYSLPIEDAMNFSSFEAGICYMTNSIDTLLSEPIEDTIKRANGTLKSGHHSVFEHIHYNLVIENMPKILAMILNNEKIYHTSEKSARYTKMTPSKQEEALYEKWLVLFQEQISKVYPKIKEKHLVRLAQENARYLISIFTPATTMGYTVDLRQLNYIIHWSQDFIKSAKNTNFNELLKPVLQEFVESLKPLTIEKLNTNTKNRSFSIFAKRERMDQFGENYSVTYNATFAQLAQVQRHRTLYYEFLFNETPTFFVPYIIRGTSLEAEWLKDITSLADFFPQGMLIKVNERGTIEKFIEKAQERLCGQAQLEVVQQTSDTLEQLLLNTKALAPDVYYELLPYSKGARCTFPNFECTKPCIWGAEALTRKI